jgi:DSF synthase
MNTIVDFQQFNNATLEQVRTSYEGEFGVMTYYMNPAPRPCFNKTCMTELHQSQSLLEKMQGQFIANGNVLKANYLVLASDVPGVFNLGGDLSVFGDLIRSNARDHLLSYARLCISNVWTFYNMQAPVTTISLVQGQAMGGGFEAALAAHVLVAEKSAVMGLPWEH